VGGREERPAMQEGGVDEMKEAETEEHEWCLYTKPLLTWLARADGGRKRWVLTMVCGWPCGRAWRMGGMFVGDAKRTCTAFKACWGR